MRLNLKTCTLLSTVLFSSMFGSTWAAQGLSKENLDVKSLDTYWTPERLQNAKPLPIPQANPNLQNSTNTNVQQDNTDGDGDDGAPPDDKIRPIAEQLYPSRYELPIEKKSYTPFNRGSANEDFSSSRLVPLTADLTYPYRAVGKLFFTIPGQGDFVCSASVLRPRVLLTAGHCVHAGARGTDGFYTNWLFVPAFRDGAAPYQSWKWTYVTVTSTWATGAGKVPNAADYGMLELEDRTVDGSLKKIGSVTGYLGYQTKALIPNHAHLLGYPCNLDRCQKMHQVAAQSAKKVDPNNAEYGSDMRGGSSGGPWVQNFGQPADGQTGGNNTGVNRVIGVTSWGYTSSLPKVQGASIFDERFTELLQKVCDHKAGNC